MAAALRILGQQDVARLQGEVLAAARLEVERAAQGDDELAHRRSVPGKGATRPGLLERGVDGAELAAQQVAAVAAGMFEVRSSLPQHANSGLRQSKNPHTPGSSLRLRLSMALVANDRSMGLFDWQEIGTCSALTDGAQRGLTLPASDAISAPRPRSSAG